MQVQVVHKFQKIQDRPGIAIVDACHNNPESEWAGINPFIVGPCDLYGGRTALVMENAWQFVKVYPEYADQNHNPTPEYWKWAEAGWSNPRGIRYPAGRGRAPLYCLWEGQRLGYIESRKRIYGPTFLKAATRTESYRKLRELAETYEILYIRDWDGWNMQRHGYRSLTQILNCPKKRMGHGFFLKAALEQDPVLDQLVF